MKRIILPLLAAIFIGLMGVSCTKEVVLNSMTNEVSNEVTLSNSNWESYNGNPAAGEPAYLIGDVEWPTLNDYVLHYGNVNAFVKVNGKLFPLPYTIPIAYTDASGTTMVPEEITFYTKETHPGHIYFVIKDMNGELPSGYIEDITFKIVATWPIDYIINQ